jgi:hypothetical protein
MLSDFQQSMVWESWLAAEIRSGYFAALVARYQLIQRCLVVTGLVLSSGATLTLLTTIVPPPLGWIKPLLTVLAAAVSLWSLVAKYERNAIDSADLHQRWNSLAMEYERLWSDMYSEQAVEKLSQLRKEESSVSKSSTSMPTYRRLMEKVQDNVLMHHREQAIA